MQQVRRRGPSCSALPVVHGADLCSRSARLLRVAEANLTTLVPLHLAMRARPVRREAPAAGTPYSAAILPILRAAF